MAARKRHDPKSTPASGERPIGHLRNRDPGRHYVYTNPNDVDTGTEFYKARGYVVETYTTGGVSPVIGTVSEGAAVTDHGQILMSCPAEDKEGEMSAQWSMADKIDRKILKEGFVEKDSLRGGGLRAGGNNGVDPRETERPYLENGA